MSMSVLAAQSALVSSALSMKIMHPIAVALLCAKSMAYQVLALKVRVGAANDTPKTTHIST